MMRLRKDWLAILAITACSGDAAPDVAPATGNAPDAAIATVVADAWSSHIAAAQNKDTTAVMAIYAPDIVYAVPPGQEVRGWEAVRAMEAKTLATADVVNATHRTLDLRVIDDRAYEIGIVSGSVRSQDAAPEQVVFDFMALWQRQPDGTWAIRYLLGDS